MALFGRTKTDPTPLDGVDVVLADLDGVVYAGADAIPHAIDSLNRAGESRRLGYITNNASRTDETVAAHLRELGLHPTANDIVTSPQAAMRLLRDHAPAGATVLVVGGDGLVSEVEKAGYVVTRSASDAPAAVVQGFAPDVGWTQLAEAAFALQTDREPNDLPWIATNTDWTIPQARGIAPGNGTLVSAVHTAVGRLPIVAGKPEVPIFLEDLRGLHEPYPQTIMSADGSSATVGKSVVRIDGTKVSVAREGDSAIDRLRAASAVIWASGRAIFGFAVPPRLYEDLR